MLEGNVQCADLFWRLPDGDSLCGGGVVSGSMWAGVMWLVVDVVV